MSQLTALRLIRVANVPISATGQQLEDLPLSSPLADLSPASLPANGVIGSLSVGATYSQAEVQALRDECENLRDALSDTIDAFNAFKQKFEESGDIPCLEDPA
jgi:hypothetical protein